jgi:hypothetical protein
MSENDTEIAASLIELAGEITIAWLQNPNVIPERRMCLLSSRICMRRSPN